MTGIIAATSIIGGIAYASETTASDLFDEFTQSEEPQQQEDRGPAQDLGTTDVTPTPDTNATEPDGLERL